MTFRDLEDLLNALPDVIVRKLASYDLEIFRIQDILDRSVLVKG